MEISELGSRFFSKRRQHALVWPDWPRRTFEISYPDAALKLLAFAATIAPALRTRRQRDTPSGAADVFDAKGAELK